MDKEPSLNDQVMHLFNIWNQYGPRKHRQMSARMKRYINAAIENHSIDCIRNAIINYSHTINHPDSWYKYKYNLDDFLINKYMRFLDDEFILSSFLRRGRPNVVGASTPPDAPAISPVIKMEPDYKEKFIQWKKLKGKKE